MFLTKTSCSLKYIGQSIVLNAFTRTGTSAISSRSFSTGSAQPNVDGSVSKSSLMELRKRTGYSISKCKQALQQFGDNLAAAEEWLQDIARKEGWAKIAKSATMGAKQGLLGLFIKNGLATVVEVNCQTDFVARNEKFRSLVSKVSRGLHEQAAQNHRLDGSEISAKLDLPLDTLNISSGTLPDLLADSAGQLGEPVSISRAFVMRVAPDVGLVGYVHPRTPESTSDGILTGYFAALVALRMGKGAKISHEELGLKLCQHIIGMNPTAIGSPPASKKVAANPSNEQKQQASEKTIGEGTDQDGEDDDEETKNVQLTQLSNEITLLRQDFMLEPDITVYQFLQNNDASVVDFVRFERGSKTDGTLHS